MAKIFPLTLKTSDGCVWRRSADYQEGPGITTHYARYTAKGRKPTYFRGGRVLYSIRLAECDNGTYVCQVGHKVADVI